MRHRLDLGQESLKNEGGDERVQTQRRVLPVVLIQNPCSFKPEGRFRWLVERSACSFRTTWC